MNERQRRDLVIAAVLAAFVIGFVIFWHNRESAIRNAAIASIGAPASSAAPGALSDNDKSSIAAGLAGFIQQRKVIVGNCADWLTLGPGTVTDYSVQGNAGTVQVQIPVTVNANVPPHDPKTQGLSQCYGAPDGGIVPGEVFNSNWQTTIEQWQSGWRVVVGPEIEPGTATLISRPAPVPQVTFLMQNRSGLQVQVIQARPSGSAAWSANFITMDLLNDQNDMSVSFDNPNKQCKWDVQVSFNTKQMATMSNQNLCQMRSITIGPQPHDATWIPGSVAQCPPFGIDPQSCVIHGPTAIYADLKSGAGLNFCWDAPSSSISRLQLITMDLNFVDSSPQNRDIPIRGYVFTPASPPLTMTYRLHKGACLK